MSLTSSLKDFDVTTEATYGSTFDQMPFLLNDSYGYKLELKATNKDI